jgi:MoxR-like ATPase
MFGITFKPLIKEKYDYITSNLSKQESTTTTKIIGHQDIIEFVDNALASSLTINVLFNGLPGSGKTLHLQRLREKLPDAFYYDFSNTSGAGFIYSLIRKAQEQGTKEMTLLLDEVDKIKPRSELFMLLNLLEGNEIHKVVKKVEYHVKLKLRVFATCNDISRLPAAFVSRFQRLTLKEYTKEQFIEVALGLASQYLLIKDADRREAIAEEIATKLYDEKNVKHVRQLIDVMKLYSIQKTKTVDQIGILI